MNFKKAIQLIKNQIPFLEDIQHKRVKPWIKCNGDKTLRLNYPLSKESVVLDLGGYEGQWASDIFSRYLCDIHIFEPYLPYFNSIKSRFELNQHIKVYSFGLANFTKEIEIYVNDDRTSLIKKTGINSIIKLRSIRQFLNESGIDTIDLIKINIEGAEYELMEGIIDNGIHLNIKNIQIQFHDFFPDAKERVDILRKKLTKTHKPTYSYDFVWENWELI
jgi:FkbM family methyltransferase